jgi:hypothetical protein
MGDARQRLVFEVRSAMEVLDYFDRFKGSLKSAAMNAAFEAIGLELDVNNITSESLGVAIGKTLSDASGLPRVNVFDADAVRAMLLREGCGLILQDLGVSGERSIDGLALAVEKLVTAELKQAAAGDGDGVLSAVNVSAERLQKMKRKQGVDYNVPRKFDKKSVANRERQAKFRELHKRVWVT